MNDPDYMGDYASYLRATPTVVRSPFFYSQFADSSADACSILVNHQACRRVYEDDHDSQTINCSDNLNFCYPVVGRSRVLTALFQNVSTSIIVAGRIRHFYVSYSGPLDAGATAL